MLYLCALLLTVCCVVAPEPHSATLPLTSITDETRKYISITIQRHFVHPFSTQIIEPCIVYYHDIFGNIDPYNINVWNIPNFYIWDPQSQFKLRPKSFPECCCIGCYEVIKCILFVQGVKQ